MKVIKVYDYVGLLWLVESEGFLFGMDVMNYWFVVIVCCVLVFVGLGNCMFRCWWFFDFIEGIDLLKVIGWCVVVVVGWVIVWVYGWD